MRQLATIGVKYLGYYLLALGAVQMGGLARSPLFVDPQVGIVMALKLANFAAEEHIVFLLWLLAGLRLLFFGTLMVLEKRPLKSYIASEIILSGPTLVLIVRLIWDYPAGLARLLLISIVVVFIIYSALPVAAALILSRRHGAQA